MNRAQRRKQTRRREPPPEPPSQIALQCRMRGAVLTEADRERRNAEAAARQLLEARRNALALGLWLPERTDLEGRVSG